MTDDLIGPSLDELRAAGPTLAALRLGEQLRSHLQAVERVQRFYCTASALGVPRDVAVEILHETQGAWAGSTPGEHEIESAREHLTAYALTMPVSMGDDLRATVQRLVTTTRYSRSTLEVAVAALRGTVQPRPDEWINQVLPTVVQMANRDPRRLADIARAIREATTWTP